MLFLFFSFFPAYFSGVGQHFLSVCTQLERNQSADSLRVSHAHHLTPPETDSALIWNLVAIIRNLASKMLDISSRSRRAKVNGTPPTALV